MADFPHSFTTKSSIDVIPPSKPLLRPAALHRTRAPQYMYIFPAKMQPPLPPSSKPPPPSSTALGSLVITPTGRPSTETDGFLHRPLRLAPPRAPRRSSPFSAQKSPHICRIDLLGGATDDLLGGATELSSRGTTEAAPAAPPSCDAAAPPSQQLDGTTAATLGAAIPAHHRRATAQPFHPPVRRPLAAGAPAHRSSSSFLRPCRRRSPEARHLHQILPTAQESVTLPIPATPLPTIASSHIGVAYATALTIVLH